MVWLRERGLQPATVARRIHSQRSFWNYLWDCEYTDVNPFRRVTLPKQSRKLPTYLSEDDCRRLIEAAGGQPSAFLACRDRAIITMLAFTGIRRGELLALELADVNRITLAVHVRGGKGGKDRVIPLTQEVLAALDEWMTQRPPSRTDALFTTTLGNRIHPSRIQITWKGACRTAASRAPA